MPTRADRARQTRQRMLNSARELFLTDGYAATTMERIADDAGVAVQTLYYTFRTKGHLLREVVEVTAAGEQDAPRVPERAWVQEMLTARSAQRVLALAVEHGADIFVRAAPLWPIVAAAASDPVRRAVLARRCGRSARWAGADGRPAERAGRATSGLDPARATDLVVVLFGHDVFTSLVTEAGWEVLEYKAWLFTALVQQLLQRPRLASTAYSDLSYGGVVVT